MKLLLSLTAIFFSLTIYGQAPQAFKYQAIARDSLGAILVTHQINVRITIIDSTASGANIYSENHKEETNPFGLFSVNIGRGINPTSPFANIPWSTGGKWIKIEIDPTGGTTFSYMGTYPLLSVPYALYSGSSANAAEDSTNELQTLSISGQNLSISNGNTVVLPDNVDDADADSTNELQALSISNDTIFLTNGGFVKLPPTTTFDSIGAIAKTFKYDDTISKGDVVILGTGKAGYLTSSTGNGNADLVEYSNQFFLAQSFKASSEGIKAVEIQAFTTSNIVTQISVSIRESVSGIPTNTDLGIVSYNSQAGMIGDGKIIFAFGNPVNIIPDSTYFIVINYVVMNTNNAPVFKYHNTNIYPYGKLLTSTNSGTTWLTQQYDLQFKLYETITENGLVYRSDPSWNLSDVISPIASEICTIDGSGECQPGFYGGGDLWTNFLGFALESGMPGNDRSVQVVGINHDQTGLKTWENYYMSNTKGKMIPQQISTHVGRALSGTEILIKNF